MRFLSLTFRHFGPFADRTLELPDNGRDLHVIYGPNEAGKSTALAGLGYFLFGFEHHATHCFRFNHTEQRLGATLVNGAGHSLTVLRRRANKNPFREADDKTPAPDDCLHSFLHGLDREQFDMLFGIGHEQLVDGGREMAEGRGSLGQALFAASAGLTGLRRIDQNLGKRLEDLFRRTGRNQPIAVALKQLSEERQRLKEETLAIEAWIARREEIDRSVARRHKLDEEQIGLARQEKQLEAFRGARPTIEALQAVEKELAELRGATDLPTSFGETYRKAIDKLTAAEENRRRREAEVESAESALAGIVLDPAVLADEGAIKELHQQYGAIRKSMSELAVAKSRIEQHERTAERLRQSFDQSFGRVDGGPRIGDASREKIGVLARRHGEIERTMRMHRERAQQIDGQIRELEGRLARPPQARDQSALEAVERELLAEGAVEKTLESAVLAFRAGRAEAEAEVERWRPIWQGPLKAIPRLNVPADETIAKFEQEFRDIDEQAEAQARCREGAELALRELLQRLVELERIGKIPDEAALADARAARDRAVDRLSSAKAPSQVEIDGVRKGIRRADEIVDGIRRNASRTAEIGALRKEADARRREHGDALTKLDELSKRRAELTARWSAVWRPMRIQAAEPYAMREWARRWGQQKDRVDKLEASAREIKRLAALVASHKAAIVGALGLETPGDDVSLTDLQARLRSAIEEARDRDGNRRETEALLREAKQQRAAIEASIADVVSSEAAWRVDWNEAVAPLGMRSDADPHEAQAILDQLEEIALAIDEIAAEQDKVRAIERIREEFLNWLDRLFRRITGRSLDQGNVPAAIDELNDRLSKAKLSQHDFERVGNELAAAKAALAEASRLAVECQARMRSLCEQAGFATASELPELIRQSELRRAKEAEAGRLRGQLLPIAAGQNLDDFLAAEAEARPRLAERLEQVRQRLTAIKGEIPETAIAANAAQRQIDEWEATSARAAERRQSIELLLDELRAHVTEYAALHLARQTLRLTIERFRERRRDSLLSNAECYFKILTRGSFRGLDVDDDDGEPVLLALRTEPGESIRIDGLSDGTRDQLFLALRLAGIAQHLRTHGPMPVVIDDILVNFDDDRAAAALECLAELSKLTQVMLFTHHAHVVELAKRVAAGDVCCHDLSAVCAEASAASGT